MYTQAQIQQATEVATQYAIAAALELQKHPSVNTSTDDLKVQTPQNKVRTLVKSYRTSKALETVSRDVEVKTIRLLRDVHVGCEAFVIDRKGNGHRGRLAYAAGEWFLVKNGKQFCNFHQTHKTSVTHTKKGLVIRA